MRTLIIAILLLSLSNLQSFADNKEASNAKSVSISGTVKDQLTNESLAGVCIEIEELDIVVYSDFDGKFEINNVKPGNYNIKTMMIGYSNEVNQSMEIGKNADSKLNLSLNPVED